MAGSGCFFALRGVLVAGSGCFISIEGVVVWEGLSRICSPLREFGWGDFGWGEVAKDLVH